MNDDHEISCLSPEAGEGGPMSGPCRFGLGERCLEHRKTEIGMRVCKADICDIGLAELRAELDRARANELKWLEAYQARVREMDEMVATLRATVEAQERAIILALSHMSVHFTCSVKAKAICDVCDTQEKVRSALSHKEA